jgi:hypothetical protein
VLACLRGVALEERVRGCGLHSHDRDRVRHDICQLANDPRALDGDGDGLDRVHDCTVGALGRRDILLAADRVYDVQPTRRRMS